MASSLNVLLTINISGSPFPFAQPFTVPILDLEREPSIYQVTIDADSEDVAWLPGPLGAAADFIALIADRTARYRITSASGSFIIEAATAGIPTLISGGQVDTGGGLESITQIDAINPDTDNPLVVSACIAQASA